MANKLSNANQFTILFQLLVLSSNSNFCCSRYKSNSDTCTYFQIVLLTFLTIAQSKVFSVFLQNGEMSLCFCIDALL